MVCVVLRYACAIASSMTLAGCAIFESRTDAREPRLALKDDAWAPSVVVAAKSRTTSTSRQAQKASAAVPAVRAIDNEPGTCDTTEQCALVLRSLVDNPDRRWIAQRPSVAVYA